MNFEIISNKYSFDKWLNTQCDDCGSINCDKYIKLVSTNGIKMVLCKECFRKFLKYFE